MDILLETLGGLVWLLIGFLGVVAFGSAAREGAGLHGDPSPPPKTQRLLVLDPAETRVIEAAKRENDRMKVPLSPLIGAVCCGLLVVTSPAAAQAPVEIRTIAPEKPRQIHIVEPSPATREATRPREADFYREDVRVRHEPAFIEPFVGETPRGAKYGLSGWTAPATPVGSLVSQGERQTNGWPSLGFTVVWDSAPTGPPRRVSNPR